MDVLQLYYHKLVNTFNFVVYDYWEEIGDPRSKDFFLMGGGPWNVLAIMFSFIIFVTKIGPKLMKGRKAFELRKVMLVYDAFVVLLNGYFFCQAVYYLDFGRGLFNFQFPNRNDFSAQEKRIARLAYLYVWTKVVDLMDTIFFVLRKKYSHITGLHLYHHSIMPIFGWLVIKIAPTSPCLGIFPLINTLIHVVMYSYYALSSFGPRVQSYLWWKKYLTQLQLAQFVIFAMYAIIFVTQQNGYPMGIWLYIGFPQPFLFGYLFFSFYKTSYKKFNINLMNNNNNNQLNGRYKDNMNSNVSESLKPKIPSDNNVYHRKQC